VRVADVESQRDESTTWAAEDRLRADRMHGLKGGWERVQSPDTAAPYTDGRCAVIDRGRNRCSVVDVCRHAS
jgi:hypothetical protein